MGGTVPTQSVGRGVRSKPRPGCARPCHPSDHE